MSSETNLALEEEIREYTDVFYQNIPPQFVPKAIGAASFFVGSSIHDVFSSSHAEALMSGCISISGDHPIYAERPGFGSKTVDGVVETLQKLTEGFQKLPDPQLG